MTTEAFPLLDLPKDIRLIIYEHLPIRTRTHTVIHEEFNEYTGKIWFPSATLVTKSLPVGLLCTCKLIHDEALPIFKTKLMHEPSRYIFDTPSFESFVSCEFLNLFYQIRKYERTFQGPEACMRPLAGAFESMRRGDPRPRFAAIEQESANEDGVKPVPETVRAETIPEFWMLCGRWNALAAKAKCPRYTNLRICINVTQTDCARSDDDFASYYEAPLRWLANERQQAVEIVVQPGGQRNKQLHEIVQRLIREKMEGREPDRQRIIFCAKQPTEDEWKRECEAEDGF